MDPILGPIIGGGISAAANIIGGNAQQREADKIAAMNIAMQTDFEKHGLEYKASDATQAEAKYGINRLALLGVPTGSFSNVVGNSDAGAGIRGAGQDIGRAIAAASSLDERQRDLDARLTQAKIDNVNADTTRMLAHASDAARVNSPGTPPAIPIPPVDPRRVNWDVHNAKPLEESYVGPHGGLISLPTAEASQAMQNWGSMPAQIAYGAQSIYSNLQNAFNDLAIPLRRDAWRGVDNSQYVPF